MFRNSLRWKRDHIVLIFSDLIGSLRLACEFKDVGVCQAFKAVLLQQVNEVIADMCSTVRAGIVAEFPGVPFVGGYSMGGVMIDADWRSQRYSNAERYIIDIFRRWTGEGTNFVWQRKPHPDEGWIVFSMDLRNYEITSTYVVRNSKKE